FISGWTGVATWRWLANDDTCGICRLAFDSCCPDCKVPGDDCPLVWGQCSHCFHIHCIMKWLNSQQNEMSLQGLPPLPKSLSTANLSDVGHQLVNGGKRGGVPPTLKLPPPPPAPRQPPPPPPRKQTKLDVQLARLRKEMYSLRELDLSLLSQLWSVNEAIQELRAMQELLSPSSDADDDAIYSNLPPLHEQAGYPLSSSSSRSSNNGFTEL
ncbi:hypothetical protein AAG570_006778, partial [Ranatra chinensis]